MKEKKLRMRLMIMEKNECEGDGISAFELPEYVLVVRKRNWICMWPVYWIVFSIAAMCLSLVFRFMFSGLFKFYLSTSNEYDFFLSDDLSLEYSIHSCHFERLMVFIDVPSAQLYIPFYSTFCIQFDTLTWVGLCGVKLFSTSLMNSSLRKTD